MEQTYTTRQGIEKQVYTIKQDGISVFISSPTEKKEYKINYDAIPANPTIYSERSKPAFWCMVIFWTLSIVTFSLLLAGGDVENLAWLFWGIVAVICTIWYVLSKKSYVIYAGFNGAVLSFKLSRKNDDAEKLRATIKTLKMKYLEEKIKRYFPTMGFEKTNGYIIELRENMILDDEGYESLVKKAEEFNTVNIVGFKKN